MNPSIRFAVFLLVHLLFTTRSGLCAIGENIISAERGNVAILPDLQKNDMNRAGIAYLRRRNEIAPTAYRSTMAGISEYSQWCRPGPDGLNI